MEVKNRIVMPSMAGMGASEDGFVTALTRDYYEARAKGGVGLVIVGSCTVESPLGKSGRLRLLIDDDKFIPGLSRVAEAIHRYGAKAALQLQHAGPSAIESIIHMKPIAASAISRPLDFAYRIYSTPREMTVEEIAEKVTLFAKAAERAQKAGFEGVEILAAHRYLINSFLSPYYNRRQDQYGGDLKNRARLLLEIISAIKETLGSDYPVWCRINGIEEDVKGGITLELAVELAQILEKTGQIAAIHVSKWHNIPIDPVGFGIDLARAIKKAVNIPVIAVGHISPLLGNRVLREKKADFIAMGRQLIADPDLPNKAAAGRLGDIVPCQRCNNCVGTEECTVNASHLKERKYKIRPAEKPRKVLVVGGGPGGMEAARVATLRGHQVVLYEKDNRLGGQLKMASIIRKENKALVKYFTTQMKTLRIRVERGKKATPALIREIKPDVVVLATGATSSLPEIPGIDRDIVLSASDIQAMLSGHLRDSDAATVSWRRRVWYIGIIFMKLFGPSFIERVLRLWAPFGRKVIVMGMRLHGVELAHFLVKRGKKVTLVDSRKEIQPRIIALSGKGGGDLPMPVLRQHYLDELERQGTRMLLGVQYEAINDSGLTIVNRHGKRETIEADTIVFVADYKSNRVLSQDLKGLSAEIHHVGDCVEPVGILEAIREGSLVGHTI
jgi:2,4-dienoyl-CoA reductase (NADPH2)